MSNAVTRVAIVQHSPAVLDVRAGLARARQYVAEAAAQGAELVVFPESWLGGYPAWMFVMAEWADETGRDWYRTFLAESIDTSDERFHELRAIARDSAVTIVMGFNERRSPEGGSVYNSLVTIGPAGDVLNLHRKLTPTHTERLGWAPGDGRGLRVVDTPVGRLGGLICWEHWHPLARYTLHAQDEQIHVASWPDMSTMHQIAGRHYAIEGRSFVLSAAQLLRLADVPAELRDAYDRGVGRLSDDPEVGFNGGSSIIGPDGEYVVEPVFDEERTIIADIDLSQRDRLSHDLDVAGHYGRRDIFSLRVDTAPRGAIEFAQRDHAPHGSEPHGSGPHGSGPHSASPLGSGPLGGEHRE